MKKTHHIYVVELDRRVWHEVKKFRLANPQYTGIKCCLYVGMTAHSPAERFRKHKTGYRTRKGYKISSSIVEKYGLYLRPSLYRKYNPLTRNRAKWWEKTLAEKLRKQGYGVWWN